MSWLDFFRKKEEKKEIIEEKIAFSDLQSKVESEQELQRKMKEEMNEQIKNILDNFVLKIKGHVEVLKNLRIDEKKENERIKFIVKENLKSYIDHLENLAVNLKSLKPEEYSKKISRTIENFQRMSINNLEKVTILVGKEIEVIGMDLRNFSYELNSILSNNRNLFEKEKKLEDLRDIFEEQEKIKKFEKEIESTITALKRNKESLERKREEIRKKLENIKNSSEYKKALEEKEEEREEARKNEENLFKLKSEIDLKFLAKHFHGDKKKEHLISELNKDFISSLQSNEAGLIALLKEAKPEFNTDKIKELIKKKGEQFKEKKELKIIEEVKKTENEIKEFERDLLETEDLIKDEEKRHDKIQEKIKEKREQIEIISKSIWEGIIIQ
ncbi:hypothetical protein HZA33_01725 [Candidatus Pacearchaeota archaeon]|nr:hypothetical protein [Candidatus Pacearchaeota archaeon]